MHSHTMIYSSQSGEATQLFASHTEARRLLKMFPSYPLRDKFYLNNVSSIKFKQQQLLAWVAENPKTVSDFAKQLNEILVCAAGELARLQSMQREVKLALDDLTGALERARLLISRLRSTEDGRKQRRLLMFNVCAAAPTVGELKALLQVVTEGEAAFNACLEAPEFVSMDRALEYSYRECLKELQ